jgi:hypothetical protein
MSIYFIEDPYNFNNTGIGLLNLAPFIGTLMGAIVGSLNDRIVITLARRNNGIFEPEMRLWMVLPSIVFIPTGIWVYGIPMAEGLHWIIPCVGMALFGFGVGILGDTSLTYVTDCYSEVVGDALVTITFIRNAFATIVVLLLDPWIDTMGLKDMFWMVGCLAFATLLPTIPMIIWGRKWRAWSGKRYAAMVAGKC